MRSRSAFIGVITIALASLVVAAAPNAPQAVSANVSGTTVTLTWAAPSTGDAPTGYVVVAALSPGGTAIATLPVTATTLAVANVPNGVYYVHVRAVNGDGPSPPSNEVVVVVPGGGSGCNAPPGIPTNVGSTVAGSLVTLTWTPAPAGCAATGYVVQAGSSPGASDVAVINVGNATTLAANAPPATYYVRVLALNAAGASAPSPDVVVTVGASVPSRVSITFDALAAVVNRAPFTTYTESDVTLDATAESWMSLTSYGNPAPFIQFVRQGTQAQVGEVTVTAGGGTFVFESVDVYSSTTPIPHEIVGTRNGTVQFTISGTVPNTFGGFATITSALPAASIDTLLIRLTNPAGAVTNPVGFDNLVIRR
jgi:predicted phage tail protein